MEFLIFVIVLLSIGLILSLQNIKLKQKFLDEAHKREQELQQKIFEQKSLRKSTEVRTGQIIETWAPFLKDFQYDAKDAHFLGSPIDYIIFDKDKETDVVKQIVFLEIKSGEASLTKRQKEIRNAIQDSKVKFEEMKIK